jgi:transposase InsO family protein
MIHSRNIRLASVSQVCACFELKRDAYYKHLKRYTKEKETTATILDLVKARRKILPREGVRKLHVGLQDDFSRCSIKIGRDKLFDILRAHNMLIRPKRSFTKTTYSYHRFYTYKNLVKDFKPKKINQLWVADITYIRMIGGFCYLALITDVYSRKIVGYDISDSLELAGCLWALKMALRRARPNAGIIHHSDRGIQYCSKQYVNLLKENQFRISMTEENHCYENAIAERVNGILKDEFYIDQCFSNLVLAKKACISAIDAYNNKRLHLSLNFKTPKMVFENIA